MTETTEPTPSPWTPEKTKLLRKLWPTDASCQQIADCLGVTKGAVIGKAHREGLPHKAMRSVRKLTPDQVRQIRQSKKPYKIGHSFGIANPTIQAILSGRTYRDIA